MPFLYIFCLLVFFSCSGREKDSQAKSTTTVDTSVMQPPVALTDEKAPSRPSTAGSSIWHYARTVDKEGRTVYKASITSPDLLEFDFPYNGGSTATLTIRKRESDTHVYIQVSKGQFNRSYQEGKARVRFDNNAPATYTFSAAENGSANVIFFNSEQALINKMKASRNMMVDVDFAGQGRRQITFKIAGLNWNQ